MSNVLNFQARFGAGKINALAIENFEAILKDVSALPAPYDFLPASLSELHASIEGRRGLNALDLANIDVRGDATGSRITFKAWSQLIDADLDLEKLPPYLTVSIDPRTGRARALPKVAAPSAMHAALHHRETCSHLVGQRDENADELFVVLSTLRYFAEKGTVLNWFSDTFTMTYTFLVDGWVPAPSECAIVEVEINWMEGFDYHRRVNEYLQHAAHNELTD